MRSRRTLPRDAFLSLCAAWAMGATFLGQPALSAPLPYPIPPDTVIILERNACERKECPSYRIIVFASGEVIWQGNGHVRKKGLALGHITNDQLRDIIDAFQAIDYMHLPHIYGFHGKGCDSTQNSMLATVTSTWMTMGDQSHALQHDSGCRADITPALTAAEDKIDTLTNSARWIK